MLRVAVEQSFELFVHEIAPTPICAISAIDPPNAASFITTVRGLGYRLEPDPARAPLNA